jgi:hypothetical protein
MPVPILTLDCERHIAVTHEPVPLANESTASNDLTSRVLAAFFAVYR